MALIMHDPSLVRSQSTRIRPTANSKVVPPSANLAHTAQLVTKPDAHFNIRTQSRGELDQIGRGVIGFRAERGSITSLDLCDLAAQFLGYRSENKSLYKEVHVVSITQHTLDEDSAEPTADLDLLLDRYQNRLISWGAQVEDKAFLPLMGNQISPSSRFM